MIVRVKFAENDQKIAVKFSEIDRKIRVNFGDVQPVTEYIGGEKYTGEYEITPKFEAQILPTAKKVLERDVQIDKIPYAEVTNEKGGKTATIG